jgi:RNA polymerase sigma factor (sigma-70 family)
MRRFFRSAETCALRRSAIDPVAFEAVYEQYAVSIVRFLARRTLDLEVARDLTAETFATAFRDRRRFRGRTDAEAAGWLFGIARHLHARYVRDGFVERRATERLRIQLPPLDADDYERVRRLADLDGVRPQLLEQLERLAPEQQAAIRLRVIEELPYEEVAARLDVSEPTARARVSRGLRELGAALDRHPDLKESLT